MSGEIAAALGVPLTNTSFHLKALVQAGLATVEQEGRFQRYRANIPQRLAVIAFLTENCCANEPGACRARRAGVPGVDAVLPALEASVDGCRHPRLDFVYDVIKRFVLLAAPIVPISYVQSYFPPERTRDILGRYTGVSGGVVAALLGTLTPFRSCSSIPLFIGFTSDGLPLGITFAFPISSPRVDLASVILPASLFNRTVALA